MLSVWGFVLMVLNSQIITADFFEISNTTGSNNSRVGDFKYTSPKDLIHKRFTKSCSKENGLLISGESLKLSDFVEFNGKLRNECHAKLIKLFASNKIIIDRDLFEIGNEPRLIIIAPKWHILGFKKINVKMFLGIAKTITNGENLITSWNESRSSEFIEIINVLDRSKMFLENNLSFPNFDENTIYEYNTEIAFNGKDVSRRKRYANASSAFTPLELSLAINDFKTYLRSISQHRLQKPKVLKFYDLLEKHPKVKTFYNPMSLVNELDSLETQFFHLKKIIDFYPFYQSLLNRISEYAKSNELSDENKKICSYLYTATLSKLYILKGHSEPNLIVDITAYFTLLSSQFKDFNKIKGELIKTQTINEHNAKYKKRFENKIAEANEFIKWQITPEIGNINKALNDQIDMLVSETKELQEKAKDEREKAIDRKKELAKAMVLRGVFSVIKVVSQLASFLGPVGTAVGAAVGGVTSITESLVLDNQPGQQAMTTLPLAVKADLQLLQSQIKNAQDEKVVKFIKKLDSVSIEMNEAPESFVGPIDTVANIKSRTESLRKKADFDVSEMNALDEELKSALKIEHTELKAKMNRKEANYAKKALVMDRVNQIVGLSPTAIDIFNKVKSDGEKFDAASAAVKFAEVKVQQLETYENEIIFETIVPMIKHVESGLNAAVGGLESQSRVALEVNKWKVQSTLRDLKLKLSKLTAEFQIQDHLVRSIEKLEEAMTTLINVYDRIENYEEQKHLADYLNDINSAGAKRIRVSDAALSAAAQKLEIVINSNVLINDYDVAIGALKQWLFPFAHLYLAEFHLPAHLSNDKGSLEKVVENANEQIVAIENKIKRNRLFILDHHQYVFTTVFDSYYESSKPFFVWNNEDFKEEMRRFLRGEEVSLKADVLCSDDDKDAVKFNLIKFLVKTKNASKQSDLNLKLKGFKISATHMGNSYYRFKDRVYVFNSVNLTIEYSLENKVNGDPVTQNAVYAKIKSGDIMLSPYTMWKVKLVKSSKKFSFAVLDNYKDEVFIELVGNGTYVGKNIQGIHFDNFDKFVV